ncbi:hypothetical protein [Hyalangium versicolor]|uniref:hypothetical protein n=1 Tax=Hyalangium versicolor TaxID=2861190 RepID=UPI001CCB01AE|nr:hypothetical protein [Hyalangium versicolor]
MILRPSVAKEASPKLAELDAEVVEPEEDFVASTGVQQTAAFAPECRPVVSWLLQRQLLKPQELVDIVETVDDFNAHVLAVAYDALPSSCQDAAKVLSAVRPAQHLNGSLGAFEFSQEVGAERVPRKAVTQLLEGGLLQQAPGEAPDKVYMPRFIRTMVARHARFSMTDVIRQTHEWLSAQPLEGSSTDEKIEIHFHAVQAGNIERAKSTAAFYGNELRSLATYLSKARQDHSRAAELFELLVKEFDEQDPYSWEYLGYNLARAHGGMKRDKIRDAYRRAHSLVPNNPLYHGRWLGFRGELGEPVLSDFEKGLKRYIQEFGDEEAVSYFAEAVLRGLKRGHQEGQLSQIFSRWGTTLDRFAPRVVRNARPAAPEGTPGT